MRVLRSLWLICALGFASMAQAQDPVVNVTLPEDPVMVGQPYVVRLDVLVPSFMPAPPVFPTFEVPGLLVRLPERSTSPISQTISGETWSGVGRTYRIYPMQAGRTQIPDQQVRVTYKDLETNEDVTFAADVPPVEIVATVPEGARDLDPLVIADDIEITQSWEIADGTLAVGDAVRRRLEIAVTGGSALFVPPLLEGASPSGSSLPDDSGDPDESDAPKAPEGAGPFLAYPEDAVVTETFDRGTMSGTRIEDTTYIAQAGGDVRFPDITLQWFKIDTGTVESVVLEGREVVVEMPPATRTPFDWRKAARWVVVAGLVVLGLAGVRRWVWPPVVARAARWKKAYAKTASAAHRQAVRCAQARDLTGLAAALELMARRGTPVKPALAEAIRDLTRSAYRDAGTETDLTRKWSAVQRALRTNTPRLLASRADTANETLPALNTYPDRRM